MSQKAEDLIDDPKNAIYVSYATLWEIAIKVGLGKLNVDFDLLLEKVEQTGFTVLYMRNVYLQNLIATPKIHKYPFDRLLIATTNVEKLVLITTDKNIHKYDVDWIW